MTKAPEHGENEYTDAARRESIRTKRHVCDILEEWLADAKRRGDGDAVRKIKTAQKFLKCRNKKKRGA